MRKFVIMTLMASAIAAGPALAADDQRRPRGGSSGSGDSSSSDDAAPSRPSRPAWVRGEGGMSDDAPRAPRAESRRQPAAAPPVEAEGAAPAQQALGRRRGGAPAPQPSVDGAGQATQAAPATTPFQQRLREHRAARGGSAKDAPAISTARAPGIAGGPRGGFLSGRVAAAPAGGKIQVASKPDKEWYTRWREQRQYNWEQHRARNRDHYHLGHYWDPYGYNYRRWQIGWMMWPSYYQDSYWLNDPYSWRLPPVYGPYRWVRYWDDALLVNIYTGQVVDVLYNVFW